MAKKKALPADKVLRELREFGLAYPGAHTKSPWPGHLDLAVNDKTFAYLSLEGEPLRISCKLPVSSTVALMLPFCTPTAYGLGKSGWVTAEFPANKVPPSEMLEQWIDESYRAQAPKKWVKQLDEAGHRAPVATRARGTKAVHVAKRARGTKPVPVAKRTASGTSSKRAKQRVS